MEKMLFEFEYEELFVLSSGLLELMKNVNKAKELVYDEESWAALDKELKMYQELHHKLMEMCE